MKDPVVDSLLANKSEIFERLFEYLRIPSVSTDPNYLEGMVSARKLLAARLTQWGFDDVQELEAGGHAAIFAQWMGAGDQPTMLIYGHYDVQPPDPLDRWQSAPFEPTIRDQRIYARGVSDDKGPSTIALETLRAFLEVEGAIPVNVKILLEGEEELGSATLADIIQQNAELLSADAVLSADGARWKADLPSVNVGSRGNCGIEFEITTSNRDLHSGRFGGAVPNALQVMSDLLSGLHNDDGGIAIETIVNDAILPGREERRAVSELPFDEDEFFDDLGTQPQGEAGYSTLERLWLRPTVEINGMWGGYTGPGFKTVIPNTAHAKLTMRLVPGQNPDTTVDALRQHLQANCPDGASIEFTGERGGAAANTVPLDHPLLHAAELALEQTTGKKPHRVKVGATLPLADIIQLCLGLDTVMFSFSTADENFHASNEFMRTSAFEEGFAAWVAILRNIPQTYKVQKLEQVS